MKTFDLANGVRVPSLGLGTWKITDRDQMRAVLGGAVAIGYQLIDTAAAYSNEMALGKAIAGLALPREELFVQDKLWKTQWGYQPALEACRRSLRKLGLDVLDAYLIHYPATSHDAENWREINAETWRAMEALLQGGYVRAIGVCNFGMEELTALLEDATIMPMIHQIECHPGMPQEAMIAHCQSMGIAVQAASPLGSGRALDQPVLRNVAEKHHRSVAQVSLRWALEKGLTVLPKAVSIAHLRENSKVFDFALDTEDRKSIDGIPDWGSINAEIVGDMT